MEPPPFGYSCVEHHCEIQEENWDILLLQTGNLFDDIYFWIASFLIDKSHFGYVHDQLIQFIQN